MEKVLVKLHMVARFFPLNLLEKGEYAFSKGQVQCMIFDTTVNPCVLHGDVWNSVKSVKYTVELDIDLEDGILKGTCTCPTGQRMCYHMAALAIHGNRNTSVTSELASQTRQVAVKCIEEIHPPKALYKATTRDANPAEVQYFNTKLNSFSGFSWLVNQEAKIKTVDIAALLMSEEYINCLEKINFFKEQVNLSLEQILSIVQLTADQFEDDLRTVKKHRLTCRDFGMILDACQKDEYPPSLFQNLHEHYDVGQMEAAQWALDNKKEGMREFGVVFEKTVTPTGLWLDKCGYLLAHPDGLVESNAIIALQYPVRFKYALISDQLKTDTTFIICKNQTGRIVVNKNHNFYHQIQGQLYLTKRSKCYLVIWTPLETKMFVVRKSAKWEHNIAVLKQFYLDKYINYIM